MTAPTAPVCLRCHHPYDWHCPDDSLDPADLATPFPCLGYDPSADGQLPLFGCFCPDMLRYAQDDEPLTPLAPRDATQAEMNIARAWVARHRWTNPRDAEGEYEHALAILVFGNARPPRRERAERS